MKHIFKQKVKCKKCGGTGIYKGFLEKGRVGVVLPRLRRKGMDRDEVHVGGFRRKRDKG